MSDEANKVMVRGFGLAFINSVLALILFICLNAKYIS